MQGRTELSLSDGWVFPEWAVPGNFVLISIDINQYLYLRR